MHISYQNVHLREYIISFHCIIFIRVHLDARNAVRRGLLELIVRSASPFSTFVIFAMINVCMLAHEFYMCFVKGFVIFPEVQPMYF